MGRILAIDYGRKKVGLAVTDNLKLIATSLGTIHSKDIFQFLKEYTQKEHIECVVVGEPKRLNNTPSESAVFVEGFIKNFKKIFPEMNLVRVDERFTSKMAFQTMIDSGLKKKDRQNKELVDTISATIILQSYLDQIKNK